MLKRAAKHLEPDRAHAIARLGMRPSTRAYARLGVCPSSCGIARLSARTAAHVKRHHGPTGTWPNSRPHETTPERYLSTTTLRS